VGFTKMPDPPKPQRGDILFRLFVVNPKHNVRRIHHHYFL
jgi:hypothetical protein